MLFVLLAVVAFYAVLFCVRGESGVLAAIGLTIYAVRCRGRRLSRLNLGINISFTMIVIMALGLSTAWFAWFGGNVAEAGIQTVFHH